MTLLHLMHKRLIAEIMLLTLILIGCSPAVEARPLGGGATPTPAQAQTATPEALSTVYSPLAAPTQPPSPLVPGDPQWRIHTDLTGQVSFEYPADWIPFDYSRVGNYDFMKFASATEPFRYAPDAVIDVHIIGAVAHDDLQPGLPNEGSFKVFAQSALAAPHAEGILYLWGEDCATCGAILNATYYSQEHQLRLSLVTGSIPREIVQEAVSNGLEATIAAHYPVFDHMVRSVRFLTP